MQNLLDRIYCTFYNVWCEESNLLHRSHFLAVPCVAEVFMKLGSSLLCCCSFPDAVRDAWSKWGWNHRAVLFSQALLLLRISHLPPKIQPPANYREKAAQREARESRWDILCSIWRLDEGKFRVKSLFCAVKWNMLSLLCDSWWWHPPSLMLSQYTKQLNCDCGIIHNQSMHTHKM